MSIALLKSCLNILETKGSTSPAFRNFFARSRKELFNDLTIATLLITEAAQGENEENEPIIFLLYLLLDDARISRENDSNQGETFLKNAEIVIKQGLENGTFKIGNQIKLASYYKRVGLSIPDFLTLDENIQPPDDDPPSNIKEILKEFDHLLNQLANEIQASNSAPYELFEELLEFTAAMPDTGFAVIVDHITSINNENSSFFERCALYLLISGSPLIQATAAAGLFKKLKSFGLQPSTLVLLPIIRGWLPEGSARNTLDEINKYVLRKNLVISPEEDRKKLIHDITASITDGAGAQNITIRMGHGKKHFVFFIMTKLGHGIKEVMMVPCRTKKATEKVVDNVGSMISQNIITLSAATFLLETALADGLENSKTPAPSFIDVIETCDLYDLRPQAKSLQDLLNFVDTDRSIQNATPQELDKLINNKHVLETLLEETESWFEDSTEIRAIFEDSQSEKIKEKKVWKYLKTRCDVWARLFLQTAIMLKDSESTMEWKLLAASAFGLMSGRPLHQISIMEEIFQATMYAGQSQFFDENDLNFDELDINDLFSLLQPQKK